MNEFVTLPEASRIARTTPDRARYWLSLLGIETFKNGKFRYVPPMAVAILQAMAGLIGEGMAPAEAAKQAREKAATDATAIAAPVPTPDPRPDDRLANLEKAVLTMAESFQAMAAENKALRLELSTIKAHLLPPPTPTCQVIPWAPPKREDPLAGKSWWEKTWIKIAHPERCRHPGM